jgi:hypothetical protein
MQNPAVRGMAKIPGEPRGYPAQPGKKGGTLVGQKGRKYGRRRTWRIRVCSPEEPVIFGIALIAEHYNHVFHV